MSNSGKVKCTCGWSWNKSDSSKKDMYICHECGRDNSNNMKNGGWLDTYADGGTMQEHQENYNDPQVSLPEGFVGMGNNTKGRNYSPAWGGQFQEGGEISMAQQGKKVKPIYVESKNDPRYKAYNDSLNLYKENSYQQFTENNDPEIKNKLIQSRILYNSLQELPTVKGKRVGFERKDKTADEKNKKSIVYSEKIKPEYFNLNKFIDFDDEYQLTGYYKKPQQEVKVKPTTTKQTTKPTSGYILQADGSKLYDKSIPAGKFFDPDKHLGDGPIKFQDIPQDRKPVTSVVNNLTLAGLGNNPLELGTNLPELRPQVRPVKYWKYKEKRGGSTEWGYINSAEDMDKWVDWRDWYSTGGGKDKGDSVTITPEYQMGGNIYPVNYVPQAAMGGSLPGAGGHFYARYEEGGKVPGDVGFDYPRTINPAPDNGPGAKKTMASAQNGQEMKYYQEGLDFKPKSISKNGGWLDSYDVAQDGKKVEYGTPEYEEAYNKGEVVTDEGGRSPILLDEVVVEGKPLTEFGKTRKEIAAKNTWEDYAQKYLGNFEKSMGQTLENLPESRKQEYEDYVNKLAFNEYIKTHPQAKGEKRGAYIDRMQTENANSSNFERAYEANADYNDATDVNKWRKGLIGLGSLVMGPGAINDLKQTSGYFSTKEKQDLIENPILSNIDTTLGTLEPLTIPVESLYGNKSFGDIASGENANIPMTARLIGDPLMLGFEAAPLIGEGFNAAKIALGAEEGLLSNAWKLNPKAYQYNLPENTMWRGLGKEGMEDAVSSGLFRSKQNVPAEFFPGSTLRMDKSFGTNPYFTPKFKTASSYGDNFLAEVPRDVANWRNRYARTDWSQIADRPISINEGRLLQKDWLQGYKPIEVPTSSLKNSYPSFKQITNAPENINAEHLAGLIKREADWLRSPEYLKRKMDATGRSAASIQKESEEIINHINNTSIEYTGANESMVVGLYSPGKNAKIKVFDGRPEYPYSDHPFYTGTLDHEVKHAFSESAYTTDKALDFIQNTGYKNYPKANLNKTFGDRVKSAFDMNWANLSAEQQVTGRRMMDVIEKDQGIKRGTELTDANIDQLVESLKLNRYVDDDIYHVATQFKRKFGDDYKKHLKDFLNKAWMSVPAVIGLDAASETDKKKDGGVIKDDMGYWNPDNWGSPVEIGSTDITMEGVYEPLLGISDTGDTKLMKPGKNYKFKGKKVTEFPMAKNGLRQEQKGLVNLDQLTNFTNYNKPQPGGWLNKYN